MCDVLDNGPAEHIRHTTVRDDWGALPLGAARLRARRGRGRGVPLGRRSRAGPEARARRHRARAGVDAPPDGPPARGRVHPVRRPAAGPDRPAPRRRGRRPVDRVLLRRLRLRGRSLPIDARIAAGDLPPASRAGEHPARDDGPARPRDAARRARAAGAARSPARRGAGTGAARALHGQRQPCPGLVPGLQRSPRRRRPARAARRSGAPMDGGRPGGGGIPFSLRLRPALHRPARRGAARLPHPVADGAGARAPARHRPSPRRDRAVARLRLGVRVRRGLQAPPRRAPGRWRAGARVAA